MFMVNKDGEEILVEDTEQNRSKARDRGFEIFESLVSPEGDERWVSETLAPRAIKEKGYNFKATQENINKLPARDPYSMGTSFAQGATAGLTMGFDDELSGLGSGAKAALKGENPVEAYTKQRDAYRNEKDKAWQDNPWSYGGGQFAGSIAIPGFSTANNARLGAAIMQGAKTGAVQGLAQGAGDAETMGDIPRESLKGVGLGTVMGGAGGLIGRGIARPGQTAEEIKDFATHTIPSYLKAGVKGFNEGAKDTPVIAQAVTAPWGAAKGVLDQRKLSREMQSLVDDSVAAGESPFAQQPTDRHYIARMLAEDGSNSIKDFIAERATTAFPGELDANAYKALLNKGIGGRTKARTFSRDAAGEELLPDFQQSRQVFDKARSNRWNELQGQARDSYKANDDVLVAIGDALEDAASETSLGRVSSTLQSVQNMVGSGKGARSRGLQQGTWDEVADAEKFNRLQQARKEIDGTLNYSKREGLTVGEKILKDLRDKIDASLKTSPEKIEADSMWTKSKNLEDSFFDQAEFKGGLDKYKIGNMLKNTESAKRFRDNIGRFEDFINDPGISPDLKAEGQALLDKFRKAATTAEEQRALHDFRYKNGPSSAAIERQTAVLGGENSPVSEAIRGPSTFMTGMDQAATSLSKRYYGTDFDKLSSEEKDKIIRAWFKIKKDPNMSQKSQDALFKKKKMK